MKFILDMKPTQYTNVSKDLHCLHQIPTNKYNSFENCLSKYISSCCKYVEPWSFPSVDMVDCWKLYSMVPTVVNLLVMKLVSRLNAQQLTETLSWDVANCPHLSPYTLFVASKVHSLFFFQHMTKCMYQIQREMQKSKKKKKQKQERC